MAWTFDPERILITPGGSGALLLASSLLVDPGKHWLLADPGYPCNRHFLRLVEGGAQLVPVGPEVNYQLTADLVERYWDKDTVGALVASPANPTGTVLDRDAGQPGATHERHGHLVVDEIYHGLTYGMDAPSVLEVDDEAFVLNSFSKYFGMTGWRLGWLVAPPAAVADLEKLAQNLHQCAEHGPACRAGVLQPRHWPFSKSAAPSSPAVATTCCPPCANWASALPSSRRARSTCMPISVPSAAMRSPSADTS
jgi:aspartate/methionine/tyrosine aminotransferase